MSDSTSARPTLEFDVHFQPGHRGKRSLSNGTEPTVTPRREGLPRITRLLALAHRWDDLIERGEVRDQAEIGRLMGLTRARVTQIMNLLYLAPLTQERLLLASLDTQVSEAIARRALLRPLWSEQRDVLTASGLLRPTRRAGDPDLSRSASADPPST